MFITLYFNQRHCASAMRAFHYEFLWCGANKKRTQKSLRFLSLSLPHELKKSKRKKPAHMHCKSKSTINNVLSLTVSLNDALLFIFIIPWYFFYLSVLHRKSFQILNAPNPIMYSIHFFCQLYIRTQHQQQQWQGKFRFFPCTHAKLKICYHQQTIWFFQFPTKYCLFKKEQKKDARKRKTIFRSVV